MKVDIVIATYNRAKALAETINNVFEYCSGFETLIVVDNGSDDQTQEVLSGFNNERLVIIRNNSNLGAAMGKNVGLRRSKADILVVLDDDAIFNTLDPISEIKMIFNEVPKLGIIQFKITNYQTRRVLKYEFPGNDPDKHMNDEFNIGYFIGAGHAIRRNALQEVGYYPENFGLYAHEEVDLSYRVVNSGYTMMYFPKVEVLHKKDPGGRLPQNGVLRQLLLNRLIMNRKYLPFRYAAINNTLWLLKTLIDSRSFILIAKVCVHFINIRSSIPISKLNDQAIKYLKDNRGRLYS